MNTKDLTSEQLIMVGKLSAEAFVHEVSSYGIDKTYLMEVAEKVVSLSASDSEVEKTACALSNTLIEQFEQYGYENIVEESLNQVQKVGLNTKRDAGVIISELSELLKDNTLLFLTIVVILSFRGAISSVIERLRQLNIKVGEVEVDMDFEEIRNEIAEDAEDEK